MKKIIIGSLILLLAVFSFGCGQSAKLPDQSDGLTGNLSVSINWPNKDKCLKALNVPASSVSITVTAYGDDFSPLATTITYPQSSATLEVKVGANRTVSAEAKNASKQVVARGQVSSVTITSGANNPISLVLTDIESPAAPTGLSTAYSGTAINLSWNNNSESDLAGYNVYRSTASGSGFSKLNSTLVATTEYADSGVSIGTQYYYKISAVDTTDNESAFSAEKLATFSNSPPAWVSAITVGSVGGAPVVAGQSSGSLYFMVIDANATSPLVNLSAGNIQIDILTIGGASAQCLISNMQNMQGQSGEPLTFALTLDRSGSMTTSALAEMETANLSFVNNMGASDQGAIINFDNNVMVDQGLTSNKSLLSSAIINESVNGGATALYDSMGVSVSTVEAGNNKRKAVIAMTDGGENSSFIYTSTTEVINHANAKSIPIYCVGLGMMQGGTDENALKAIASGTGGIYYYVPSDSELAGVYSNISSALASYYVLNYSLPSGMTFEGGKSYKITLQVVNYGSLSGSTSFWVNL